MKKRPNLFIKAIALGMVLCLLQETAHADFGFKPAMQSKIQIPNSKIEEEALALALTNIPHSPSDHATVAGLRLTKTQIRDVAGTGIFILFSLGWNSATANFARQEPWHGAFTLQVTGLAAAIISNYLIQKAARENHGTPWSAGFWWRQMIGAIVVGTPMYGYLIYPLLRLIPGIGWNLESTRQISAGFQAMTEVFLATPLMLNPMDFYGAMRVWFLLPHSTALKIIKSELAEFSVHVLMVEIAINFVAYIGPDSAWTFAIMSAWSLIYLRLIANFDSVDIADGEVHSSTNRSFFNPPRRLLHEYYNRSWLDAAIPAFLFTTAIGGWGVVTGVLPLNGIFWLTTFGLVALGSWMGMRLWPLWARWRVRADVIMLHLLIQKARELKNAGASSMDLVVWMRILIERFYYYLNFWIHRTGTSEQTLYRQCMIDIFGPGAKNFSQSQLNETDFARLTYDYLELADGHSSARITEMSGINMLPVTRRRSLVEEERYGLLLESEGSIRWTRPHPALDRQIILRSQSGVLVPLRLERLTNADIPALEPWVSPARKREIDLDLSVLIQTGLKPGEYGYKLVSQDGTIEGFIVLFNARGYLHAHMAMVNPLRIGGDVLRGVGRALLQQGAMVDALQRNVYLLAFPTTPAARRLILSLGFKRLAVDGSMVSCQHAISPDQMRAILAQPELGVDQQLPPASEFYDRPDRVPETARNLIFNGVHFQTLEPLLYSRRLYKRYKNDPDAFEALARPYLKKYFAQQDPARGRYMILDSADDVSDSLEILTMPEYRGRLKSAPAVALKDTEEPYKVQAIDQQWARDAHFERQIYFDLLKHRPWDLHLWFSYMLTWKAAHRFWNGRHYRNTARMMGGIVAIIAALSSADGQTSDPTNIAPKPIWNYSLLNYTIGDPTYAESTVGFSANVQQPVSGQNFRFGGTLFQGGGYDAAAGRAYNVTIPSLNATWLGPLELGISQTFSSAKPTSISAAKSIDLGHGFTLRDTTILSLYSDPLQILTKRRASLIFQNEGTKGPFDVTLSTLRNGTHTDWQLDSMTTLGNNHLWFSRTFASAVDTIQDISSLAPNYGFIWWAWTHVHTLAHHKNLRLEYGGIGFKSTPGKSPYGGGFVFYLHTNNTATPVIQKAPTNAEPPSSNKTSLPPQSFLLRRSA